jgi:hypothetical protein
MRPSRKSSLRASRSDFSSHPSALLTPPSLLPSSYSRTMASSSSNPPPPAERAAEIIDKLPSHPSLITKTGTAILGSGLLATAISQELYVFNEETVIAVGYFILFAYIAKVRWSVSFHSSIAAAPASCYPTIPKDVKEIFTTITPYVVLFCGLRGETERVLIETCPRADRPPAVQRVGREPHCSHQGCARWCARRTHAGREGPHR